MKTLKGERYFQGVPLHTTTTCRQLHGFRYAILALIKASVSRTNFRHVFQWLLFRLTYENFKETRRCFVWTHSFFRGNSQDVHFKKQRYQPLTLSPVQAQSILQHSHTTTGGTASLPSSHLSIPTKAVATATSLKTASSP